MKAYSYLRFSTREQMKGASLSRQLEKSAKYAADNGLVLDSTLKLQDLGVSAYDSSNVTKGALGTFIDAIDKGFVEPGSFLIVESLDRVSRAEPMIALELFLGIIRKGVTIITLSDNQTYSKESIKDNSMLLFGSIMVMIRAYGESSMKSERIGDAWRRKVANALEGKIDGKILTTILPLWMQIVDGKVELIPDRAATVKQVFQMLKDGMSMLTISKFLNANVQAWSATGKWDSSYIGKLSRNHAVYGAFESNGKVGEIGYYPAAISKEEFDYVRHILESRWTRRVEVGGNKKGSALTNLFSGIITCGYCCSNMHIGSFRSRKTGIQNHFLGCAGARNGSADCKHIRWSTVELEALFFFKVSQVDLSTALGSNHEAKIEAMDKELLAINTEIELTQKKIHNLYEAIAMDPIPGLVRALRTQEDLLAEQEKASTKLESNLNFARMNTSSGSNRMKSLITLFKTMKKCEDDLSLRRIRESLFESIRNIVTEIVLYPSGPSANKLNTDMRYAIVTFKSGETIEISDC